MNKKPPVVTYCRPNNLAVGASIASLALGVTGGVAYHAKHPPAPEAQTDSTRWHIARPVTVGALAGAVPAVPLLGVPALRRLRSKKPFLGKDTVITFDHSPAVAQIIINDTGSAIQIVLDEKIQMRGMSSLSDYGKHIVRGLEKAAYEKYGAIKWPAMLVTRGIKNREYDAFYANIYLRNKEGEKDITPYRVISLLADIGLLDRADAVNTKRALDAIAVHNQEKAGQGR